MKITKAQKDAVISLLKEKFDEKQKIENEKFYKEHEAEITLDIEAYKGYIEALSDICTQINRIKNAINDLFKQSNYLNDDISQPSITYGCTRDSWKVCYDYSNDEDLLKSVKINTPDYTKVARQLELDTLSKDFNLDKFIQKYLEN